jgi:aminoglycoside phosphotransferase (APT) family kinase protein
VNFVESFIQEHAADLGLDRYAVRKPVRALLITPQFASSRHVIGLVLSERPDTIALVAKIPRRTPDSWAIRHEADLLRRLHALWPGAGNSAPQVVTLREWRGRHVLIETAVNGQVMRHGQFGRRVRRYLPTCMEWLASLPVTGRTSQRTGWYDKLLELPLRRLERLFESDATERGLLTKTRRSLAPLHDCDLPLVFEHGDFSVPNLLWQRRSRSLGVIDWELAHDAGLPGHDVEFFLAFVASARAGVSGRAGEVDAFRDAFLMPEGWARLLLRQHLEATGVDADLVDLLLLASRARYGVQLLDRLGMSEDSGPTSRSSALALFRTALNTKLWWLTASTVDHAS